MNEKYLFEKKKTEEDYMYVLTNLSHLNYR